MNDASVDRPDGSIGQGDPPYTSSGFDRKKKEIERTQHALMSRPNLSLWMQIFICFIISFIVICVFASAQWVTMRNVEHEINFWEAANNYLFEIQEIRRMRQLGSGREQIFESAQEARTCLNEGLVHIQHIFGGEVLQNIDTQFNHYVAGLHDLLDEGKPPGETIDGNGPPSSTVKLTDLEKEIITYIQKLLQQGKNSLNRLIRLSASIHAYSLLSLFLIILLFTFILARRILARVNRFVKYTQRIATGDYTLIVPARSYRDEFSDLAAAINQMIMELELRQTILVQSHKLKAVGTLTAGVAHELNNPLNNISLTAYMFQEDYETLSDQDRLEMIQDVIQETERGKKIVKKLLDFARESEVTMEPLDIGDVICETLELMANQVNLKGVQVEVQTEPNLPLVNGDRQQLCQVFINVILNALDVTPKGKWIRIHTGPTKTAKFVAVKITDSGPGIPDHVIPSVFDPFYTTKANQGGTGLGLSVSQGIVAKHNGEISAYSEEGLGSTFTVALPAIQIEHKL